jgi:hypothetical protein
MRAPRSSLSTTVALPEAAIPEGPREILRRGATGEELEFRGWRIRAGDLPLFARDAAGNLRQCVRVRVRATAGAGARPVDVTIAAGGAVLATGVVSPAQTLHLLVPETSTPVDALLTVGSGRERLGRPLRISPQRKWRVFVVHHSHLDLGYTDPPQTVLRHHLAYLDAALDHAAASDCHPDDSRFRWNVESALPLQRWLATRPPAAVSELVTRVRERRFEVCALPFGANTEALSIDELGRLLQPADDLRASHGVDIRSAMQTDVPGASLGLPGMLAAAGIRYLSVAHNYAGRAAPYLNGGLDLPRLFYWASPAGSRVLVWQTDSPHGVAYLEGNVLGLADSAALTEELLPEYLSALAANGFPYGQECAALGLPATPELRRAPFPHDLLHLRVQGVLADNAPPSLVPASVARAFNERWAYPQLRIAGNSEFFEAAEARLGDSLETFSGDWTSWWADGIGSGARPLGFNRRAQAEVRIGQTLNVLADLAGGRSDWEREADRVHENIALFDEHTWGAAHPDGQDLAGRSSGVLQWQAKSALAASAFEGAVALTERGAARLVTRGEASILVVNTAGFARTDVVRAFVPLHRLPGERFAVTDDAGDAVPIVVDPPPPASNRPQGLVVSFLARDVPPVGSRAYALVAADRDGSTAVGSPVTRLENEHLSLELDLARGCVARLRSSDLGRELVDGDSPFGFGGLVHDRYAGSLSATLRQGRAGAVIGGGAGPVGDVVVASRSFGGPAAVVARASTAVEDRAELQLFVEGASDARLVLRVPRGVARRDLVYRLRLVGTAAKASTYVVFPFAFDAPAVLLELTGGVASPDARLPGSARHLHVLRHWAVLADRASAVALASLEAPLGHLGNIFLPYPPYAPTVDPSRPGTLVSWVLNNVWDTNFALSQAGETRFAYSIGVGRGDARELGIRTSASLTRPLVAVVGGKLGDGSFCSVDPGSVELVTLGPSRRGHDFAVLLHSLAPEEVEARISFPALDVARAWAATFLERHERDVTSDGGARLRLGPGEYVCVAVDLARA